MKKNFLPLMIALILSGCQGFEFVQDREIRLGSGKHKPYVFCVLRPDSIPEMDLRWSVNAGDDTYPAPIYDATPVLFRNGTVFDTLRRLGEVYFGTRGTPVGGQYQLEVSVPGFGKVTSSTTFPQAAAMLRAVRPYRWLPPASRQNQDSTFAVDVTAFFPSQATHFAFQVHRRGAAVQWKTQDPIFQKTGENSIFNPQKVVETDGNRLFIRAADIDSLHTFRIWTDTIIDGTIQLDLVTLTPELHQYLLSMQTQRDNIENIFSEPVPVISNIRGGFGVFASMRKDSWLVAHPNSGRLYSY